MPDPALTEHVNWLRRRRLSEDTVRLRLVVLRNLADHTRTPLLEVTAAQVEAWEQSLSTRSGPISDSSRATYVSQVRAFYAWAIVNGHLTTNPSLRLVTPKLARRQPRTISEDDLAMALMTAPPRIAPWLELAAYAGFRAGEVAALTREDIHDELATPVLLAQGKGRKERVVPMAPRVWAALERHGLPKEGFVFPRLDGEFGRLPAYRISQLASAHLHSLGIPCTLHSLRHYFATVVYRQSGYNLRLTQDLLGHASPATTAIYTHWTNEEATAAVFGVAALGRRTA
jgi:integrase/recombinase XerC